MPKKVDVSQALTLPPKDVIAHLESKGHRISWNWHDTWQEAHAKAFTVAKATRMDVLQSIHGELNRALEKGLTERQFIRNMQPQLEKLGWWGKQDIVNKDGVTETVQLGSPSRLKTIYRTNVQTAYQAGHWKTMWKNREHRPYLMYVAMMGVNTRPSHAALRGQVFPITDPIWRAIYPPNGFNCRCRVRALTARQIKSKKMTVQSSEGRLKEEMVTVATNKHTGKTIRRPVTTYSYKDREGRAQIFSPDPGWSYNVGEAAWQPDLDRYPRKIAQQHVEGTVSGPDFKKFFDSPGSYPKETTFPVGVLDQKALDLLNAKNTQTVLLSADTLQAAKINYPEILIDDYQLLPAIIVGGEVVREDDSRIVVSHSGKESYEAVIEVMNDGGALHLTAFHHTLDAGGQKEQGD